MFWTVARLQRGVSLAGDCIFNEALLSLCPGLWYDYARSYSMVFPLLVTVSLMKHYYLSVQDCGTTTLGPIPWFPLLVTVSLMKHYYLSVQD